MKDGVYLYFGDKRLTSGSFDDLRRMNMQPKVGLHLTFYDFDADDEGRPVYLCVDGRLCLDAQGKWCAEIDEGTFRTVQRERGTDTSA